jgi:hypothetical protein
MQSYLYLAVMDVSEAAVGAAAADAETANRAVRDTPPSAVATTKLPPAESN